MAVEKHITDCMTKDLFEQINERREIAKSENKPILRDKTLELLLKIAKEKQSKRILEIGTNVGLTGVMLLLELKNAKLTGIEIDEDLAKIAKQNYKDFGVENRAKMLLGDAREIIPMLTGSYDLIFLDGPKGQYFEFLPYLKKLLSIGGVIFADDILFHGYIEGETPRKHITIKRSIENYLENIQSDLNFKTKIYDIEDGVCVSEKQSGKISGEN